MSYPEDSAVLCNRGKEGDAFLQVSRGSPLERDLLDTLLEFFVCDGILVEEREKSKLNIERKKTPKTHSSRQTTIFLL